jgi:hypothetical protein
LAAAGEKRNLATRPRVDGRPGQANRDPEWMKEEGRFVPYVTTFLNAGRWTDADALNPKASSQNQVDPDCPFCSGTGFEETERDGQLSMKKCRCRQKGNNDE